MLFYSSSLRDRIIELKLWHCGKLNSTQHGKLRQTQQALTHFYPSCAAAHVLRQLCIWLLWPQYTSRSTREIKKYLVYCGGAAVGIDAPQYKPFCTVPFSYSTLSRYTRRMQCYMIYDLFVNWIKNE